MVTKKLSIHRPSKKEFHSEKFGHYLAGLIDGNGHISTIGQIVISFNEKDYKSAQRLRSTLGYGKVRKVKDKNACNLIVSKKEGIIKIALLIKDKLKHPSKIAQYNSRLVEQFEIEETVVSSLIDWNTPWFSGFFDADGYLRIDIIYQKSRANPEVRLLAQIDQKSDILLKQIQKKFNGGYLGYRKLRNICYYSSVSFSRFLEILKFFDRFSLQHDRLYLRYVLLRKAYLLVQAKKHLQVSGLKKIQKYCNKLEKI